MSLGDSSNAYSAWLQNYKKSRVDAPSHSIQNPEQWSEGSDLPFAAGMSVCTHALAFLLTNCMQIVNMHPFQHNILQMPSSLFIGLILRMSSCLLSFRCENGTCYYSAASFLENGHVFKLQNKYS